MKTTKSDLESWDFLTFVGLLLASIAVFTFIIGMLLSYSGNVLAGAFLTNLTTFLLLLAIVIILYTIAKSTISHLADSLIEADWKETPSSPRNLSYIETQREMQKQNFPQPPTEVPSEEFVVTPIRIPPVPPPKP